MLQTNIRPLQSGDIEILGDLHFSWSTREETVAKWTLYLEEQQKAVRMVSMIELNGKIVGYGSLLLHSEYPFFRKSQIREINDLWIFEEGRKQGMATLLIAHLEKLAKQQGCSQIGLGVGLYQDYGPAQRLYFQLGYKPDGNGITYKLKCCLPGDEYPIDDDLILWLTKCLV